MKSKRLLGILILQLIVITALFLTEGNRSTIDFDKRSFTVTDTATISRINLRSQDGEVTLKNSNGRWFVHDTIAADESLIRILKSVLNRVEIKRPVSQKQQEAIRQQLTETGTLVKVYSGELERGNFYAGGNAAKTISYFMNDEQVYRVEIPGYKDYVSAIFGLKEYQWKDRLLFNSSWRSINEVTVDYANEQDFTIRFVKNDLSVLGVTPLDSTNMMNYLAIFSYFQINEFIIPGKYPRYDSLVKTPPIATLNLTDIDPSKSHQLRVFPAFSHERYSLAADEKDRMMMISNRRLNALLPPRSHFVRKEE